MCVCYICILEIFSILTPSLTINQIISVPPEELILPTLDGGTVSIPIPNSHIGKKPIQLRLLSSKRRLGMVNYFNLNICILYMRYYMIH